MCDLGRCTESFRRAPVSSPSTRIDPKGLQTIQPSSERLLQSNEEIPRPELPAVRVAGELQLKARLQRGCGGSRLMRQQNSHDIIWSRGNGGRGIAAVRFIEMMSAVIRDSGDHQRAVVVLQDHMLIEQDLTPRRRNSATQAVTPL